MYIYILMWLIIFNAFIFYEKKKEKEKDIILRKKEKDICIYILVYFLIERLKFN